MYVSANERCLELLSICFQARRVSTASKRRMVDCERWRTVEHIGAGQSVIDIALFFSAHHFVILQLWRQFQTSQTIA